MTQATFRFVSDVTGGDQFTVVRFSGHEAISALYRYEIQVKAPLSAGIVQNDLLDSPARFVMTLGDREYPVFGILSDLEELNVSFNNLEKLPDSFSMLKKLKALNLRGNSLSIPLEYFRQFPLLEELVIDIDGKTRKFTEF